MMRFSVPRATTAEVSDRVQARYKESGYRPLCRLNVKTDADAVVVTGQLPSFYLKQLAQTLAREVCGQNHRVQNDVTVECLPETLDDRIERSAVALA